jgi:CO/xanthine dehydrogenase FAD-binding subunit
LVSAIELPLPGDGFGAAYTRLVRRRGTDLASVTMCASVDARDGVRLAYGSVGPRAFLVDDDSGILVDEGSNTDDRDNVMASLLAQASPSKTSIRAAPDYRLAMLTVLARRALDSAVVRRTGRVT